MAESPDTISMIHPDLYNRALRDFGIEGVRAVERDGRIKVETDEGAAPMGELVNAIAVAHIKLIAAESQVSLLRPALARVRQIKGLQADDYAQLTDVSESLEQVIRNLSGIAREPE